MIDLYQYQHGIYAFDSGYIRPLLASIHIMVEQGRVLLIDTASYEALPKVLEALQQLGLGAAHVDYIFLTHIHLDHAGGAGALMQACPNAQLVVHPRGERHMAEPSKLFAAVRGVYGAEQADALYGAPTPIPAARILAADEGFSFSLGGRPLVCWDTPGHARHHLCLWDERSNSIFTGDIFGLSYRELDVQRRPSVIPTTSPSQFDPAVMHQSVSRIVAQRPDAVYMTHFSEMREVARIGGDLHRLIDAHLAVAERERHAGAERSARIEQGLWDVMDAEALRQGWEIPREQWREVLRVDIELNAQGLHYWLDHG